MSKKGLLIVVSGPSGSGKGTVIKNLLKIRSNIFYSVSATTREPRPGEVEGKNYFFLTREEFINRINEGKMLEYAEYCKNFYGTPKTAVDEMLLKGDDVVLEIEVQGAINVKKACPDAVLIFLMPPSFNELERRLRKRGTERELTIEERLKTAKKEITMSEFYDYYVINDKVSAAANSISTIITAEKHKISRMSYISEEVLNNVTIS